MGNSARLGAAALTAVVLVAGSKAVTQANQGGVIECGQTTLANGITAEVLFVRASEGPSAQWNCDYATRTVLDAFTQMTSQEAGGITLGDLECLSGPDRYGPFSSPSYFFTCSDAMGSGVGLRAT